MTENGVYDRAFVLLCGVFTGSLVISAVLAAKIVTVFGLEVPAGVFAYCLTFLCTDVINEIWGREKAKSVILAGFLALVVALGLIQLALWWPAAPFWEGQEAFREVLSMTPRIIAGSILAYWISQYHDIWAFHLLRRLTRGRYLWLRNNLSTLTSQLLDSCVFITVAFVGVMPLLPLILGQWAVKVGIAAMDTLVVYAIVWWIRDRRTAPQVRT